jgi:hypothetical protein
MWRGRYVSYDRDFSMVHAAVLFINGERDLDFGDPARPAKLGRSSVSVPWPERSRSERSA